MEAVPSLSTCVSNPVCGLAHWSEATLPLHVTLALPPIDSIMAMQDFWSSKYFNFVEKKVSREQLFDLSVAQEAKARLDRDKPFGP